MDSEIQSKDGAQGAGRSSLHEVVSSRPMKESEKLWLAVIAATDAFIEQGRNHRKARVELGELVRRAAALEAKGC